MRPGWTGVGRLGHAGNPIQNLEDALRTGRGSLRHREHPAHRFQPGVEPHDEQVEAPHVFGLDAEVEHAPGAKGPYHQQAGRVQEHDQRPEEGPHGVHAVIGLDHAVVGALEAGNFALLLGERLDDADAGNGVGQDVGHFRPGSPSALKSVLQLAADVVHQPTHQRQRQQASQRQQRVPGKQNHRHADEHQNVAGKVDDIVGQEIADAIRIARNARNQVTGALAAEEFQRQFVQVRVSLVAQVAGNALADARHHDALRPTQQPRGDRRAGHAQ